MEHPRRIVDLPLQVLIHTFFSPLPINQMEKKEILFSPLQWGQITCKQKECWVTALCFVGPTCVTGRLCPQGMNKSGNKCGSARGLQETREGNGGASFHTTSFPSRCLPVAVCLNSQGTPGQLLITIHTLFTKKVIFIDNFTPALAAPREESALNALVFCGSRKGQPAQG